MKTPLVSISCITYNHAPFIRQCLDGFLMQQCNFPIEIIINDDCSTDGTTEIIREYAEKYPDKIFPIFHEENQWSKGVRFMSQKFVFPKTRGKYIALCEGDDYWTDPLKLQKQVDFLESHPDYSMCFHSAIISEEDVTNRIHMSDVGVEEREYSLSELLTGWCVATASIVCRRNVCIQIPYHKDFIIGDNLIICAAACSGRVYGMNNSMSVYRKHASGWTRKRPLHELQYSLLKHDRAMIRSFPLVATASLKNHLFKRYLYLLRIYRNLSLFRTMCLFFCLLCDCPECVLSHVGRSIIRRFNDWFRD